MPWEVAFHHRRRERWHLRELWSSQYCCEMIDWGTVKTERQCSQLSGIGKGGAQCRIALWFSCKILKPEYLINVGIHSLMCSLKLCCVPDFGDFGLMKTQFLGRHVVFTRYSKSTTAGGGEEKWKLCDLDPKCTSTIPPNLMWGHGLWQRWPIHMHFPF